MIAPDEFHEFHDAPALMSGERLREIVSTIADEAVAGEGPVIRFRIGDTTLLCIFDDAHDRMRVLCPIAPVAQVTDEQRDAALEANFHSAAFIHPLSSLAERDFVSGIAQTRQLALTFGGEYSSGALHFGG